MFLGEFEHSVDSKGRVAIPAKFRPFLENGLVITRGFERNLQVYPMEVWKVLADRVSSLPVGDADTRSLRRLLFASAFDTELDKQGRILIPGQLRDYAHITEGAVFAGMNTFMEIWSAESWADTIAGIADQGSTIATALSTLGI
jgi:MraZ protein